LVEVLEHWKWDISVLGMRRHGDKLRVVTIIDNDLSKIIDSIISLRGYRSVPLP
jgi:hypothetical protein